jgi:glucose/mannose-6-phosphate isomerase
MGTKRPSIDIVPDTIIFAGMGGSAIAGDIIADVARSTRCPPVMVTRDYSLPGHVGKRTLVVITSYSGNTEETLGSYDDARGKGARIVCVTTGGRLAEKAGKDGVPVMVLKDERDIAPRAAMGHMLVPAMMLLEDIGAIEAKAEIDEAVHVLKAMRGAMVKEVPTTGNRPKAIARALEGRFPVILAPNNLATAARRWQTQLNENAKVMARWDVLPEMDHNDIVAWSEMTGGGRHPPAKASGSPLPILLLDPKGDERLVRRMAVTRSIALGKEGLEVAAEGQRTLARLLSLIYVGDHVSTYLAILKGKDPTPVTVIERLKKELSK